jgi:tetratricopeptide (TPR) repeat protein
MREETARTVTDPKKIARVRALPGGYLTGLLVASFFSSLVAYVGYPTAGLVFALLAWVVIPLLWIMDGIVFDGRRIARTGIVPRLIARAFGIRDRLKLSDIEQVETAVFPGIKRGRNLVYTYRTTVSGKTARFVFSSGHTGYQKVISSLLARLPEDVLDLPSIDLRDYLVEKADLTKRAEKLNIPSSDVLDGSFRDIDLSGKSDAMSDEDAVERSNHLRRIANELRISGHLLSALEAFRRAAVLRPRDARILFEFAACIQSFAGTDGDPKLEQKALAMMRLAERHARHDRDLLERIGAAYSHIGEWRRAAIVFRRTTENFGESFRTVCGMAELALREGKLAHVVHNFATAYRLAHTESLRRWTKAEAAYFEHLSNDEEYMELEISRVNLLDTLEWTKRSALRITLFGFGAIVVGLAAGEYVVANICWAVSGLSLVLWVVMIVMVRMLSARIPFELFENDESR